MKMDPADGSQLISIMALTIIFGAFVLAILVIFNKKKDGEKESQRSEEKPSKDSKNELDSKSDASSQKVVKEKVKSKGKDATLTHPMLLTTLKGHTGSITKMEFSKCGKYLGSCSEGKNIEPFNISLFF